MTYKEFSSPHSSKSPIQDSARVADLLSLPLKPLVPFNLAAQPPHPQTHLKPCRSLFRGLCAERTASAQAAQCRPVDSVVAAVPRDAAICSRPGCGKQRRGEASAPQERQFLRPRGSAWAEGGGPGLGSLYLSPPIGDPSLCPPPSG